MLSAVIAAGSVAPVTFDQSSAAGGVAPPALWLIFSRNEFAVSEKVPPRPANVAPVTEAWMAVQLRGSGVPPGCAGAGGFRLATEIVALLTEKPTPLTPMNRPFSTPLAGLLSLARIDSVIVVRRALTRSTSGAGRSTLTSDWPKSIVAVPTTKPKKSKSARPASVSRLPESVMFVPTLFSSRTVTGVGAHEAVGPVRVDRGRPVERGGRDAAGRLGAAAAVDLRARVREGQRQVVDARQRRAVERRGQAHPGAAVARGHVGRLRLEHGQRQLAAGDLEARAVRDADEDLRDAQRDQRQARVVEVLLCPRRPARERRPSWPRRRSRPCR